MKIIDKLPDVFCLNNGKRVEDKSEWNIRRSELLDLIQKEEYGYMPPKPESIIFTHLHTHNEKSFRSSVNYQYSIDVDGKFQILVRLMVPEGEGPFPVIINGDGCWRYASEKVTNEILKRGYIFAEFNRLQIVPDNYINERNFGLYNAYPEGNFGALAAWAWGYHRVIDLLETLNFASVDQIGITGHSRGGKAVLLAGATDERIAVTNPNNSGCGGAGSFKLQADNCEKAEDLMKNIPYWFCENLRKYVDNEKDMPFDQHFLEALVAPRGLLSTEALGDLWANPQGTWQIHKAALEVYKFLEDEAQKGIFYREGEHSHRLEDWCVFLDFCGFIFTKTEQERCYSESPFQEDELFFDWRAPEK